jgi:hypothetical protein
VNPAMHPLCGVFDGPITEGRCDVCSHDGISTAVEPLVRAWGLRALCSTSNQPSSDFEGCTE